MNAVEIAEAVAELVEQPFKPEEFPYSFLAAFDNPQLQLSALSLERQTIRMLRASSNATIFTFWRVIQAVSVMH